MGMISPKLYARALINALEGVPVHRQDGRIKRFVTLVKRTGGMPKMCAIIDEIENSCTEREGGRVIRIETARPLADKQKQELVAAFKTSDHIKTTVKPELIAGIRIVIGEDLVIDNTFRKKLTKLFS